MSDHLETYIEPELEARITAMVLGEASAFEIEELERLIESRPELRLFRKRMELIHGLLRETGTGEIDAGEQWQLPGDKREALLKALDEIPDKALSKEKEPAPRKVNRILRWLPVAATIALLLGAVSILSFPSFNRIRGVLRVDGKDKSPGKPATTHTYAYGYGDINHRSLDWKNGESTIDSDFDDSDEETSFLWDSTTTFEMAANDVPARNRPASGSAKTSGDRFKENPPGGFNGRPGDESYSSDEPQPTPEPAPATDPKPLANRDRNGELKKNSEALRVPDDGLFKKNINGSGGNVSGGIGGGGGPGLTTLKDGRDSGQTSADAKPGRKSKESLLNVPPDYHYESSKDTQLSFPTGENETSNFATYFGFDGGGKTYHGTPERPKKGPGGSGTRMAGREVSEISEPDMPSLDIGGVAISGEATPLTGTGKSNKNTWFSEDAESIWEEDGYTGNEKNAQTGERWWLYIPRYADSNSPTDSNAVVGDERYDAEYGIIKGRDSSEKGAAAVAGGRKENLTRKVKAGVTGIYERQKGESILSVQPELELTYRNSKSERLYDLDKELGFRRIDDLKRTDEEEGRSATSSGTIREALTQLGATLDDYTKIPGEEDGKYNRGEQKHLNKLNIAGNTKTKDHIVRREVRFSRETHQRSVGIPTDPFVESDPEVLKEVEAIRNKLEETRTEILGTEVELAKKEAELAVREIDSIRLSTLTDESSALRSDQDAGIVIGTHLQPKKLKQLPTVKEKEASLESFSTFSLHVSDVSFKLAYASLAKGEWPDPARIRIEEFVNAFDYEDPIPSQLERVSSTIEQAIHPTMQQRNLLRIAMRTAESGRNSSVPLNLTFLIDSSGSMERFDRQDTLQRAFALLANQLQESDKVTLIGFARQPRLLAEAIGGNQANKLIKIVSQLPEEGGTNLEGALNLALQKGKEHKQENSQNRIILLTDGAANLGDANPERLAGIISKMRASGIAFDAAGIGADGLNDEILEALTRKGDGRYYLLDRPEEADSKFARQIAGALRPAAMNVKVQVEFNPLRVGHYQLHGFEKHRLKKEDFRNDSVDAAEMSAAEAGVALYQFEPLPDGTGDVGSVSVRFKDMSTGRMVEKRWPIPYQASMARLDDASETIRLATAATLTASKLKGEPLGVRSEWDDISKLLGTLSPKTREHERVKQLSEIVNKARAIQ